MDKRFMTQTCAAFLLTHQWTWHQQRRITAVQSPKGQENCGSGHNSSLQPRCIKPNSRHILVALQDGMHSGCFTCQQNGCFRSYMAAHIH